MAQAPANNPLASLEFQVRDLISRGSTSTLSAAENILRSFAASPSSKGDISGLQKELNKKREANKQQRSIQSILKRGRKEFDPRAEIQRLARQAPLERIEQEGPAAEGVVPAAGEPGGPALFSNLAGQTELPDEGTITTDLLDFTEQDIADLANSGLPVSAIKVITDKRNEALAARQTDPGKTTMSDEARKAFDRRAGTLAANRAAPLGVNAIKFLNPDNFQSASPDMSENDAVKAGMRVVQSNNPQFVSASRAAKQILREFRELVPKLFTDKGGPRYSNFASIHLANLAGDADAGRFIALIESTRALFSRASGDVANIAVAEQEFQSAAIPGAGDSKRQAIAKLDQKERLLDNIVRAALGLPLKSRKKDSVELGTKLDDEFRVIDRQ